MTELRVPSGFGRPRAPGPAAPPVKLRDVTAPAIRPPLVEPLEAPGLSPDELVSRIRASGVRTNRRMLTQILDDLRRGGHAVEDVHGLWRLSDEAAHELRGFGQFVAPRRDEEV